MNITEVRLLAQCRYELALAERLRGSTRAERASLYSEVYELYHIAFPEALEEKPNKLKATAFEASFVRHFTGPESVVAELGPGGCDLSLMVAPHVKKVFAVDVANYLYRKETPTNFEFILCDGFHYPLPDNAVDVVVCNELIEHLHPDDAFSQVGEMLRILKPGGVLLCGTPNRISGPHDCSNVVVDQPCDVVGGMYVSNGLHLREYTNETLATLLLRAGFKEPRPYCGMRGTYVPIPLQAMVAAETMLKKLPLAWRTRSHPLRALIGVRMAARK